MAVSYNKLIITVYSSGATFVNEPALKLAEGIAFSTIYPGGLFGSCAFFVPRDVTRAWTLKEGQRLTVRNGLKTVWEGRVTSVEIEIRATGQGNAVTAVGYWGDVLMMRSWRKPWADTRIDDGVWIWTVGTTGSEKCDLDRNNRLRLTPKSEAWTSGDIASIDYYAPTGQTIKRITYSYDFQEAGQAWSLSFYDVTNSATIGSAITASATGSVDSTLATPSARIQIRFAAAANQTGVGDGTIYGQVTSLVVYTETGAIDLTEITKDVRARATELSANESLIASNTYSLVPFVSETGSLADILTDAAAYGDSSLNSWAVGVRESDLSTDGKPIVFAEAYPALSDFDYAIRLDEAVNGSSFTASRDVSDVRNWVGVEYQDESGRTRWLTPDDAATLKDATSITAYGERHEWLRINTTSTTTATNYARRYLAARKDPQWRVSRNIQVVGYVRGKSGIVPASEIRAGKRIKVENFLNDLSGSGLTLLITGTSYSDAGETCQMSVGRPDNLDAWLAQSGAGR